MKEIGRLGGEAPEMTLSDHATARTRFEGMGGDWFVGFRFLNPGFAA